MQVCVFALPEHAAEAQAGPLPAESIPEVYVKSASPEVGFGVCAWSDIASRGRLQCQSQRTQLLPLPILVLHSLINHCS